MIPVESRESLRDRVSLKLHRYLYFERFGVECTEQRYYHQVWWRALPFLLAAPVCQVPSLASQGFFPQKCLACVRACEHPEQ